MNTIIPNSSRFIALSRLVPTNPVNVISIIEQPEAKMKRDANHVA